MKQALERFRITFGWTSGRKRYDDPERPSSWPALFLGLLSFLDEHEGTFALWFDDNEVEFSIEWDLRRVFEYLPRELEGVIRDENANHSVSFASQSTPVSLTMVRTDQVIAVEFEQVGDPSQYYAQFFGRTFHVDAAEFISEWVRFASTVLDAVLEHTPSFKDDPEIKAYAQHLELVRSAVRNGKVDPTALPPRA